MFSPDLMMKLVSKREWVLMLLTSVLMSVFMGVLLLMPFLTWVILVLSLCWAVFCVFKVFIEKDRLEGVGLEKTLQSMDLSSLLGQNGKGSRKKSKK